MSKKKLNKNDVVKMLKKEWSSDEAVKQFGLDNKNSLYDQLKKFKIDIIFDKEELEKEILIVSKRLSKYDFCDLLGIHTNAANRLPYGSNFKTKTIVKFCKMFDVKFLITVDNGNSGKRYNMPKYELKVPIDLQRWLKKDVVEEKYEGDLTDRYRMSENIDVLNMIREALAGLMKTKGINYFLQDEILSKFDLGVKQSIIIGIKSQKSGKGEELEFKILQELLNEI